MDSDVETDTSISVTLIQRPGLVQAKIDHSSVK